MERLPSARLAIACALLALLAAHGLALNTNCQTTYHWHLQQPIYWPAEVPSDKNQYQFAWQSMQLQSSQGGHPDADLQSIFGDDDRVAAYQYRCADAIDSCDGLGAPDMGAQVSYSGCLMENINSLGQQSWGGYSSTWNQRYAQERQKLTSGGFPKLDLVSFTYHHVLGPLVDRNSFQKEIEIHKNIYPQAWGSSPSNYSKGFFPAEMAFSERMIPTLVKNGIEWVMVPNNHFSRACKEYPYVPSGDNNNPPNPADQVNPKQDNYFNQSISRGCVPNNAYPFSYQPHYAKYVDPEDGTEYKIIVVPAAMAMSWDDGYACYGTQDIETLAWANDPKHPMLFLFAHDGDNDFGGGYSYYMQCVSGFVEQAVSQGYNPTTIQQYLKDFPVDEDDVIHVEDGAWVNADGDFGAPRMINWNWPLTGNGTAPDYNITNGWGLDERNWAVITASQNFVDTAEQVSGGVRIPQIQQPTSDATEAELAWHFHLPSMTSGYMYYGDSADMPDKESVATNIATAHAKNAIQSASSAVDLTPPSMWYIMRHPYNPGGYGMGSLYNYVYTPMPNDFYIYTFVYDVSGVASVTLSWRKDDDGANPLEDSANELYRPEEHGVRGVGAWVNVTMTRTPVAPGNESGVVFNFPPDYIADEYYAHITGLSNVLIDYYVTAVDQKGNAKHSDICHAYVGDNSSLFKPVSEGGQGLPRPRAHPRYH
eukprot:TRINITY_DN3275_c0_g1_i1.p1 TRINITY_DN3275_c0_g1~~TRINITY_DN3275_c0_g1_i1.p1  ORF type:complete len:738 (-),score=134.45 TRINITY_DN3275_c0_g1_i1:204-2321(-)